jgi:bifunctional UDP-N-acetylglucosamine pyrophosphorylase/glucosamine-1-phosphate N-acetyltransferase
LEPTRKLGAVVMAAGLGKRMQSRRAKVLHTLAGVPVVRYPLDLLRRLGAEPVVVVVGHQAEEVIAACNSTGVRFAQQSQQRGTGHAAQCAAAALEDFTGDLLLLYADLPLLTAEAVTRLIRAHRDAHASLSLLTATVVEPRDYGRIVRSGGRVVGIVEERDASAEQKAIREVNVGVYCASSSFLFPALTRLQPNNAQGELYLTDVVAQAVEARLVIADAPVAEPEVAQISSRADLAAAERALRARLVRYWLDHGVSFEDPDTAYLSPGVFIGADTVVGPNVTLRGETRIGSGCRLDGTALLIDSIVGNDAHVKFGVVATEARVGDRCIVGPFAQLRPGTHLAADVHIGDFVETKNAIIGARTKANHLAYIGDAEVGSDSNIGAGTITCNYDGLRKHRTVIGDRVQVGSDTQLVAPVTIGDDAYIASGTTVMEDVPPGALVFNRKNQIHRAGWAAAWRAKGAGGLPARAVESAGSGKRTRKKPAATRLRRATPKKRRQR